MYRSLLLIVMTGVLLSACRPSEKPHSSNPGDEEPMATLPYDRRDGLNDTALWIAGKSDGGRLLSEELRPLAENKRYPGYERRVRAAWERYDANHLAKMREWNANLSDQACGRHVFYPFSGPDIAHAVTLFPNAPSYVMIGLEHPGSVPEIDPVQAMKGGGYREGEELGAVYQAVGEVLGRNFFKTIDMAVEVGANRFSGVSGLLLFFLSNLGYEIVDGYTVRLTEDGRLVREDEAAESIGVAYFVRRASGPMQTVVYLKYNLADSFMGPEFEEYLRRRSDTTTMLKAASYLMYRASFDGIRSGILGRSECILTDSSGVPFHYLDNGRWNLRLFGVYRRPVPLFRDRFQPELYSAMRDERRTIEELPFSYGYNYGPGLSHLIFASRRDDHPKFRPVFDRSTSIGESTAWANNTRTIERRFTDEEVALTPAEQRESRFERPNLHGKKKK